MGVQNGGELQAISPLATAQWKGKSRGRDFYERLTKRPTNIVVIIGVLILLFLAAFGEYLAPYDPLGVEMTKKLSAPSMEHLMGTDDLGRDIFSRILAGARISVQAMVVIISVAVATGIALGSVAGFYGGRIDEAIMRVTDMFLAFPALILAMAIAAALGPNLQNAMVAVAMVWWPWYARLVRGLVLSIKEEQYVEAARAVGASKLRIMFRHILPNYLGPISVQASMDMGAALVTTASLSFIGLGAQPPTAEWGSMIGISRRYLLNAWWYSTFPGLAIFTTVLAFNSLGEVIEDLRTKRIVK